MLRIPSLFAWFNFLKSTFHIHAMLKCQCLLEESSMFHALIMLNPKFRWSNWVKACEISSNFIKFHGYSWLKLHFSGNKSAMTQSTSRVFKAPPPAAPYAAPGSGASGSSAIRYIILICLRLINVPLHLCIHIGRGCYPGKCVLTAQGQCFYAF